MHLAVHRRRWRGCLAWRWTRERNSLQLPLLPQSQPGPPHRLAPLGSRSLLQGPSGEQACPLGRLRRVVLLVPRHGRDHLLRPRRRRLHRPKLHRRPRGQRPPPRREHPLQRRRLAHHRLPDRPRRLYRRRHLPAAGPVPGNAGRGQRRLPGRQAQGLRARQGNAAPQERTDRPRRRRPRGRRRHCWTAPPGP